MTQSGYGFELSQEVIDRLIKEWSKPDPILEAIMAKKAERVPKKYRGDIIKIKPGVVKKKTARKKAASKRSSEVAPKKPASIYPPWPKVE